MGRMYSNGKGVSGSIKPFRKEVPAWLDISKDSVIEIIVKLAKKGESCAKIGTLLRDQHGVGCVKTFLGKSLSSVIEENLGKKEFPEDLSFLIQTASTIRKHFAQHPRDKTSKYQLNRVESRIYRLSRYYKRKGSVSPTWRYQSTLSSSAAY